MKKLLLTLGLLALFSQPVFAAHCATHCANPWLEMDMLRRGVSVQLADGVTTGAACPCAPQCCTCKPKCVTCKPQCCTCKPKCCTCPVMPVQPTGQACPIQMPCCPDPCCCQPVITGEAMPVCVEEPVRGYW